MGDAVIGEGVEQSAGNVFLAERVTEGLGAVLAVKDLRRHTRYYSVNRRRDQPD